MSATVFGIAFAATLAVLLTVWLAPYVVAWVGLRMTKRLHRELREFEERRRERADQMRAALDALDQITGKRDDSMGGDT